MLFAEATTSDGTRTKAFFSSHFAAAAELLADCPSVTEVLIQPVGISYVWRDGLPLGRAGRAGLAWYGDMTLLPNIWTFLAGGCIDCHIVFAPPVAYPRGANRKFVAGLVYTAVRKAVTDLHSGRDLTHSVGRSANRAEASILMGSKTA